MSHRHANHLHDGADCKQKVWLVCCCPRVSSERAIDNQHHEPQNPKLLPLFCKRGSSLFMVQEPGGRIHHPSLDPADENRNSDFFTGEEIYGPGRCSTRS